MNFTLECELEEDGRWLAEVLELPGVLAYGHTKDEAMAKAEVALSQGEASTSCLAEAWLGNQETDRLAPHASTPSKT